MRARLRHSGRVAQWESTVFTRRGSLVQSQPRPPSPGITSPDRPRSRVVRRRSTTVAGGVSCGGAGSSAAVGSDPRRAREPSPRGPSTSSYRPGRRWRGSVTGPHRTRMSRLTVHPAASNRRRTSPIAAFAQNDVVPAVHTLPARRPQRLEPCLSVAQRNPAGQRFERPGVGLAADTNRVLAFDAGTRVHEPMGQLAVIGEQEQAGGVEVQTTDRDPPAPARGREADRTRWAAPADRDARSPRRPVCDSG